MVEYYRQRASEGGLIVSEATCVSEQAHGYPCTPTLYLPGSVEAWKPVVQARAVLGWAGRGWAGLHLFLLQLQQHPQQQCWRMLPGNPSACCMRRVC